MTKLMKTLDQLEVLMDQGAVSDVRNTLIEVAKSRRIPREARLRLAHLARRAHMPGKAVALLHRTVRPGNSRRDGGTPEERAEYAASLTAIGAPREAQSLLEGLEAERLPIVWYFRAMAAVYQWDWEGSIQPLERFAQSPGLQGDFRHWARNFLANSLTRGPGDYARAEALLNEVISETSPSQHRMAYKNALLNLLQNETLRGNAKNARRIHERIEQEELDDNDPLFTLVVEQWRATADLMSADSAHRSEPARRLRRILSAYENDQRWENARGVDFHLAIALGDRDRLLHLGFGTPFPAFRTRAFAEAQKAAPGKPLPSHWDRTLPEDGKAGEHAWIDSADGRTPLNPAAYLKPGFMLQRLFATLASDFYKPLQITELHEAIYPGEKFLPEATPDRIHQLILRLRLWFEEHRIPLEIHEKFGSYSLAARTPFRIRVWEASAAGAQAVASLSPEESADLERLRKRFAAAPFSAGEAAAALGKPLRTTIRRLNDAMAAGAIKKVGQARGTRYLLQAT